MLASKTPAEFEAARLRTAVREELAKNKGKRKKSSSRTGKGPGVFNQNKYTVDLEKAELVMCDDEIDGERRQTLVGTLVHPYDAQANWEPPSGRGGAQQDGNSDWAYAIHI